MPILDRVSPHANLKGCVPRLPFHEDGATPNRIRCGKWTFRVVVANLRVAGTISNKEAVLEVCFFLAVIPLNQGGAGIRQHGAVELQAISVMVDLRKIDANVVCMEILLHSDN